LGVSRSGYYDWLKRDMSQRARDDIELLERIRRIHQRSLKEKGMDIGKNRVARLMRAHGIRGRVVTVTRRAPKLRQFQQAGMNLRLNEPSPIDCNEQWVADLTYIKVGKQYQHLITIMDVYSRRILGWY